MNDTKTMFCSCGCTKGVVLKYDKDDEEIVLSLVGDMFYTEQKSAWSIFIDKCRKIWTIIRNKEYYYFSIWIEKEELQEFKDFVSKM